MSLDQLDVVDAIGIDRDSGASVLTIADSWDWSDESAHVLALERKINAYLAFIESGQIAESYPKSAGRRIVIDIIGKHAIPPQARMHLEKASAAAATANVELTFRLHPQP